MIELTFVCLLAPLLSFFRGHHSPTVNNLLPLPYLSRPSIHPYVPSLQAADAEAMLPVVDAEVISRD